MKSNYFLLNSLIVLLWVNSTTNGQPPIKWQKALGGSDYDFALSITKATDGGYVVAGETNSPNDGDVTSCYSTGYNNNGWIVKLNDNGNIVWTKCLGGSGGDALFSIKQTSDSGYIACGASSSNDGDVSGNHGSADMWVIKLDANGNIKWQKTLGGTEDDYGTSVVQTTDGGYAVGGMSYSNNGDVSGNHGNGDFWVVKLDTNGNIQWQKTLGGSDWEVGNSIVQTTDGGYAVGGMSYSNNGDVSGNHGGNDMLVIKLDANGNIQWQKTLGGSDWEVGNSIVQTTDNGYIVTGNASSNDGDVSGNHGSADMWVVKLDTNGNIQWQKTLGGSDWEVGNSIVQTTDNGYIAAGVTYSNDGDISGNHGNGDFWVVKLDANGNIKWQKTLGGGGEDNAFSIIEVVDSNSYVIAGRTINSNDGDISGNHGNYDYWVVKLGSVVTIVNDQGLRIKDQSILVYPNPTQGLVNLTYNLTTNSTTMKVEVSICDILGREVMRIHAPSMADENKIEIDISNLSKGVYVIKVAGCNPESLILNP